ncbi:hypothetical protein [Kitasatospora camelliae]|uniref:Uncharacterized protein n=1 Tax=Kitasatospora camelliae TaxID=3156397 RepID=A0AAU8K327_9ACTN
MSTNPKIRAAADVLASTSFETRQAPDPYTAMAHRLEEANLLVQPTASVYAALPVRVRRTGLAIELDTSALMRALLTTLADQFSEDPEGVGEALLEISQLSDSARAEHTLDGRGHAEHARDEKLDALIEDLGGAEQQLTFTHAWQVVDALARAAGPRIPRQGDTQGAVA